MSYFAIVTSWYLWRIVAIQSWLQFIKSTGPVGEITATRAHWTSASAFGAIKGGLRAPRPNRNWRTVRWARDWGFARPTPAARACGVQSIYANRRRDGAGHGQSNKLSSVRVPLCPSKTSRRMVLEGT
ncbi:unnamed protein product, partial [Iphiclides podalirius]